MLCVCGTALYVANRTLILPPQQPELLRVAIAVFVICFRHLFFLSSLQTGFNLGSVPRRRHTAVFWTCLLVWFETCLVLVCLVSLTQLALLLVIGSIHCAVYANLSSSTSAVVLLP